MPIFKEIINFNKKDLIKIMFLKNFYSKKIILFVCLLFIFLLQTDSALAQATYKSLVQIPGMVPNPGVTGYLGGLYAFLISVVGVVAMGAIVIGGARYLTSVGNPSAIEDAKHTIWSAIYGLILALVSWVMIGTINPDILVLKNPAMPWKPAGYNPTTGGSSVSCAQPGGNGTVGCKCIDNPNDPKNPNLVYALNTGITPSKIVSLAVIPAAPTSGVGFTISGDLKDASGSVSLSGKQLRINVITSDLSSSFSIDKTTNGAGHFEWFREALGCKSIEKVEVVFDGDNTYASTEASLNYSIIGGASDCSYTNKPGSSILSSGDICNAICSNKNLARDREYHCIKADLRAGLSPNTRTTANSIEAKVGDTIYFDAATYSVSLKPIMRYNVSYTSGFFSAFYSEYGCNVDTLICPFTFPFPFGICDGITGNQTTCAEVGDYRASAKISDSDCNESKESVVFVKCRGK